jgi:hypothetical protein
MHSPPLRTRLLSLTAKSRNVVRGVRISWLVKIEVRHIDHLLELNIVLKVMESPDGPCDQLAPEYRKAKGKQAAELVTITKVNPIIEIVVKNYDNLVFAENLLKAQVTLLDIHRFQQSPTFFIRKLLLCNMLLTTEPHSSLM